MESRVPFHGPRGGRPAGWGGIIVDHIRPDNELPTSRANIEIRREETDIRLEGSAWPPRAVVRVNTTGPAGSPLSVATTMLLVVTAASVPAVLLGVGGWLVHLPALVLVAAVPGLFFILFVTCTILAFRTGTKPAAPIDLRPVDIPRLVSGPDGNGSARHRANRDGNGTKPRATSRHRRDKPSRR